MMMGMRGFNLLMTAWGFTCYELLLVAGSMAAIILAAIMPVWGLASDALPSDPLSSDSVTNSPPTVTLVVIPSAPRTGERVSLVGAASDIDGDPMSFDFWVNEEPVYRGGDSLLEWVFSSPGTYVVKFAATDNQGSDTAAISLTVKGSGISDIPTIAALPEVDSVSADARDGELGGAVGNAVAQLTLESRSLSTGDPVPAGLTGEGLHALGNVGVQITSILPGYAFAGWYHGRNKVSDTPRFDFPLGEATTLVAYLVKLSVELGGDSLEVPENGSVDLVIRLSALPLLPVRINLLEQVGERSFLVSGAEAIVMNGDNWDSGFTVQVSAPGDSDATDGSARLVFGGDGVTSDEIVLVERDAHSLLEVEVVPKEAGLAFGGGLVSRGNLEVVGVQPAPGFQVQQWQVVHGDAEIQEIRGSEITVKAAGSGLVRAILAKME